MKNGSIGEKGPRGLPDYKAIEQMNQDAIKGFLKQMYEDHKECEGHHSSVVIPSLNYLDTIFRMTPYELEKYLLQTESHEIKDKLVNYFLFMNES